MRASTSALAVERVTKRYRDLAAVDDVSLAVSPGEIYALLGLNGAGKTTLIRMLLGMVRPSGGSVVVLGTRVTSGERSVWSRVGYLVETPSAYPELTVRQNLEVVRRLRKLPDRGAVVRVMERLALTRYADRPARTLSLGNAQRLGLAKALVHGPDLLILDEPANGLDPAGVVEVRTLLRQLVERDGATVFLSSHILAEVARLATRIGVIHEGRLVDELDADELGGRVGQRLAVAARDAPAAAAALRAAGFAPVPEGDGELALTEERAVTRPDEVATLLVRAGCPPTRLVVSGEDLESYFLRLVGAGGG
jgi:ABC-2 type transport system ATP-binding protein